jgi:hypothetical protein
MEVRDKLTMEQCFPNCFARGPLLPSKSNHGSSHPFFNGSKAPWGPRPPHYRGFTITHSDTPH